MLRGDLLPRAIFPPEVSQARHPSDGISNQTNCGGVFRRDAYINRSSGATPDIMKGSLERLFDGVLLRYTNVLKSPR